MLTVRVMKPGVSSQLQYYAFIIFLLSSVSSQGVDQTREPETSGSDVVKATVAQIQDSRIFPSDNGFLRRLAYVESKDGTDPSTYRVDYHGGIWQIDEDELNLTKRSRSTVAFHDEINLRFKINWLDVEWIDLRKPLYSALAASLYLSTFLDPIPHISDINGQATYWKEHYDTDDGSGTIEDFVLAVDELKSEGCTTARLDIAFVVDSSGSIGIDHFLIAREFIGSIVRNFDIGSDGIRVGLLHYAAKPTVEFFMNDYTDLTSLLDAIGRFNYTGGGTNTGAAINATLTELFGAGKGARNKDNKVPRIAIVLSDGKSGDEVRYAADVAREDDITLFAIGIGKDVEHNELQDIANDPDERYLFEVQDFDVIDNIRSEISQGTCDEPTDQGIGEKLNGTLNSASKVYLETDVPPSGKMTFSLTTKQGKVTAYLSTRTRNPNAAFHEWSAVATEKNPLVQVFIDTTSEDDETRRRRQTTDDDKLVLYGTVVNEESPAGSDVTTAPGTETIFSVIVEEGDTRIITTTEKLETTTTPTTAWPSTSAPVIVEKISESGLSVGVISGIAVAGFIALFLVFACLTVFFIRRKRAEKAEPNLLNRGRNQSTVSTMSAEMRRQSETTNVYGDRSNAGSAMTTDESAGPSTSGVSNGGMMGDLTHDFIKPGQMEKDSNPRSDNIYTFGESTSHINSDQDDDIYVISEFNGKKDVARDDRPIYENTVIGQDDVYEVTEFP